MRRKTFFIADTHFGHKRIIAYEKRPFATVEEMNQTMIENWNRVVGEEDRVFVLGDFSLLPLEETKEICQALHGEKILVMGNHDTATAQEYLACGFAQASPYPLILEEFWMLSHEPLYVNTNMPYANLFGHVHGNPAYADVSPQSFCVSAERIGYTPISFSAIKKAIEARTNN